MIKCSKEVILMKMNIIVNKYLLIWNLLYQSSVSEDIHKLKQKLWHDHKKEYSLLHKDKDLIINDLDDYIPDDDLIFNLVESDDAYKKVKIETNRYRLNLLELWDLNRKRYLRELNKLLRKDFLGDYTILVVHPNLNVVDTFLSSNTIVIGKKINARDEDNFLTYLIYKIVKNEINKLDISDNDNIVNAICELLITNELFTRVTKDSKYALGKKELREVKEKIYPYWLMYLGVDIDNFEKYMVRDNIFFNISSIKYNDDIKDMDILEFIKYILKNKRVILNRKVVTLDDIEVL